MATLWQPPTWNDVLVKVLHTILIFFSCPSQNPKEIQINLNSEFPYPLAAFLLDLPPSSCLQPWTPPHVPVIPLLSISGILLSSPSPFNFPLHLPPFLRQSKLIRTWLFSVIKLKNRTQIIRITITVTRIRELVMVNNTILFPTRGSVEHLAQQGKPPTQPKVVRQKTASGGRGW